MCNVGELVGGLAGSRIATNGVAGTWLHDVADDDLEPIHDADSFVESPSRFTYLLASMEQIRYWKDPLSVF